MKHNCNFNKTALLSDFRRILWRINQYKKDAKRAKHKSCLKLLETCEKDLQKHCNTISEEISKLAKKGEFEFCKKC